MHCIMWWQELEAFLYIGPYCVTITSFVPIEWRVESDKLTISLMFSLILALTYKIKNWEESVQYMWS